jgi:ABC-2 type transport system permease protein
MNVFLRELATYRKSTIIWMVTMGAFVFLFMAGMWPAFSSDIKAAKELLQGLPPAVTAAFSISLDNFFTVFGFYAYFLTFATVAAAMQAMNIGVGVISKEFSGKTADFLMSKPVKRWQVLTAKLAAALTSVVLVSVTFGVMGYIAALIASKEPFSAGVFFLLSLTVLLVQVFFLALGALFAVWLPKIKSVVAVSLPTVFAFFIVGTLGEIVGNEEVRYLTPFKFFDSLYIMNNTALETKFVVLEVVLVAVLLAAAYVIFQKKNLRASA